MSSALVWRGTAVMLAGLLAASSIGAQPLVISEFRLRGPNGANDEFIEVHNPAPFPHFVAAMSGTGYAIAASDGIVRFIIPNGFFIPGDGHFLAANLMGYSLTGYPAGTFNTANPDGPYFMDIPDNAGIALFRTSVPADFSFGSRFDAVGSFMEMDPLYKEGPGYPPVPPFAAESSLYRDNCGKPQFGPVFGDCPTFGMTLDTNNNLNDFILVDPNGMQRLGAPGPENQSSPVRAGPSFMSADVDTCAPTPASPNLVRDLVPDPGNNAMLGKIEIRRTFTNTGPFPIQRLRFRIIDLSTFPGQFMTADLRPLSSTPIMVTVDRPPCGAGTSDVAVDGTVLEQPPAQPLGGGYNSSWSVASVSDLSRLESGESVNVRFLLGVELAGSFKLRMVPEVFPSMGSGPNVVGIESCTDGCPAVAGVVRASSNPTAAASVDFTVTFDRPVVGVDASDFVVSAPGLVDAFVTGVSGQDMARTVTVATGTGAGTLKLDVNDDDSIVVSGVGGGVLGGPGFGNGAFFAGQVYDVDRESPLVTVEQAATQADPFGASPIAFSVVFSEAVSGFATGDITLSGTAGATTAIVTGGPTTFDVAVSGMTANGTVIADVAAAVATDPLGNANVASTSSDNTVTFNGLQDLLFASGFEDGP